MKPHQTIPIVTATSKKLTLLVSALFLLTIIPLGVFKNVSLPSPSPSHGASKGSKSDEPDKKCNVSRGQWVRNEAGPYYTNETCSFIFDFQNCLKFGRPDREFLKWRWQPDECDLPMFDAARFFEVVGGKSMAFVGDSVARNHMQSLLCLLARVVNPVDVSLDYSNDTDYFKRYFYPDYNFTIAGLWSPYLVHGADVSPGRHSKNSVMELALDKPDAAWAGQVAAFNYVIISAGQWFFRPLIYREADNVVGCHKCGIPDITPLSLFYGYRMAFRTAFSALSRLEGYEGVTILRTFSPEHFENGDWDKGGRCERTTPFLGGEKGVEGHVLEFYLTQVEEMRAAERRGLRVGLLDTTEAMVRRPDGHPDRYGHSPEANVSVRDCVHWCLPGAIDTWNELLLYLLDAE